VIELAGLQSVAKKRAGNFSLGVGQRATPGARMADFFRRHEDSWAATGIRLFLGFGGDVLDGLDGDRGLVEVNVVITVGSHDGLAAAGQVEPLLLSFGPRLFYDLAVRGLCSAR
jgi:hypothetical protein